MSAHTYLRLVSLFVSALLGESLHSLRAPHKKPLLNHSAATL